MKTHWFYLILAMALSWMTHSAQAQTEQPFKPGEQMKITLSGVPASESNMMASSIYTVSDSGTIALTHINEIRATGLTPSNLSRTIEAIYKRAGIYTNPRINVVRVADPNSNTQVVSVSGEVQSPRTVQLRPGMKLLESIVDCGGFSAYTQGAKVLLIRNGRTTTHNLKNVSKNPEQNVELKPGDSVIVKPGSLVPGFD
jgi:protein involved in polysaccharide export with SLBB domain